MFLSFQLSCIKLIIEEFVPSLCKNSSAISCMACYEKRQHMVVVRGVLTWNEIWVKFNLKLDTLVWELVNLEGKGDP
ncbi:hypothetical protein H5410_008500 [Solanum commersonii]|uniref:Uncharacterized protein n=1 Tax=Solanum commersonii TaxID=4109 RepID=A0A9J6AGS3_SOLCO|nr:hypothetical protein H5410_008500 [Solanum commersonii]